MGRATGSEGEGTGVEGFAWRGWWQERHAQGTYMGMDMDVGHGECREGAGIGAGVDVAAVLTFNRPIPIC